MDGWVKQEDHDLIVAQKQEEYDRLVVQSQNDYELASFWKEECQKACVDRDVLKTAAAKLRMLLEQRRKPLDEDDRTL